MLKSVLRAGGGSNRYALEAAIAAVHGEAASPEQTDWRQIVTLYELLLRVNPSPVAALNRAGAVAMAEGPQQGLRMLDELEDPGELSKYHLLPAAKAYVLRMLGRWDEAISYYRKALALAGNEPERRFLEKRLSEAVLRQSGA